MYMHADAKAQVYIVHTYVGVWVFVRCSGLSHCFVGCGGLVRGVCVFVCPWFRGGGACGAGWVGRHVPETGVHDDALDALLEMGHGIPTHTLLFLKEP